jgi:putative Holliday junction resolvase
MQRLLGIDYGRARIGLAISDELQMLAHPLETIKPGREAFARIREIVGSREVATVVVGMPKLMSGAHGTAADEVTKFIGTLQAGLKCPVVSWDERLTTVAAERALHAAGKNTRQMRSIVDQVAAQMILQSYLDSRAHQLR